MDATYVMQLLRDVPSLQYDAEVGGELRIPLPRIPLVPQTEFLGLRVEVEGDVVREALPSSLGDGSLLPESVLLQAMSTGTGFVHVRAFDRLSRHEIAGIEPLTIRIDVCSSGRLGE